MPRFEPPRPEIQPQEIDANGILHVSAKDLGTQKEQKITVSGASKLDDAEVERMKKEAEEHAAEDEARKEAVEVRNTADQAVFQAEKLLSENKEQLNGHAEPIEGAVRDLKGALEQTDVPVDDLKQKTEALQKALEPAVMEMYQKASQEAQAVGGAEGAEAPEGESWSGQPSGPEDVVDSEFENEDGKKD